MSGLRSALILFLPIVMSETAWVYAQTLRLLHQLHGTRAISVYPYQIGDDNEEAIASGAFWFYRKLGFRSMHPDLEKLAQAEERKVQANPKIPHLRGNRCAS